MSEVFKKFKPTTPSLRNTKLLNKSCFLKNTKPLKNLTKGFSRSFGKNHKGILTNWNKGGGHKRSYRKVDFLREETGNNFGFVIGIEYDPNRNSKIIRIFNPDNHNYSYLLEGKNIKLGEVIRNSRSIRRGSHVYLKEVPIGITISNLSSGYKKPGKYLRAAGTFGQVLYSTNEFAKIKIRSGEHRIFSAISRATLGNIGNESYRYIKIGKAGRNRWLGRRPIVRGVAINPVDHPHGGGEGKTSGGRPSVTPWGKSTKNQPVLKKVNKIQIKLKPKNRKNVKS
jgi:large subunit ribosomal protein L2